MSDATDTPPRPSPARRTSAGGTRVAATPSPVSTDRPAAASPTADDRRPAWATLWLTDRDILAFTAIAVFALVLLIGRWLQISGWGLREVAIERLQPLELTYRLDLNSATWVEFAQLDGVGETLAERIVEHRQTHGPYLSVDDLDAVKGIGPKTLERLRPYLRVEIPKPAAQ